MQISKGLLASTGGALLVLLMFFIGPWVSFGVGPIRTDAFTGFNLVQQGQSILLVVPFLALVSGVVVWLCANGTLANQLASVLLLVFGLIPLGFLLFALPNITSIEFFVRIPAGQAGLGLWGTMIGLALIVAGGVMNLLGVE